MHKKPSLDILYKSKYVFREGEWQQVSHYCYSFQNPEFKLWAKGLTGNIRVWSWSNQHTPSTPCYHSCWDQVIRTANHYMNNIDHMLKGFEDEEP